MNVKYMFMYLASLFRCITLPLFRRIALALTLCCVKEEMESQPDQRAKGTIMKAEQTRGHLATITAGISQGTDGLLLKEGR